MDSLFLFHTESWRAFFYAIIWFNTPTLENSKYSVLRQSLCWYLFFFYMEVSDVDISRKWKELQSIEINMHLRWNFKWIIHKFNKEPLFFDACFILFKSKFNQKIKSIYFPFLYWVTAIFPTNSTTLWHSIKQNMKKRENSLKSAVKIRLNYY